MAAVLVPHSGLVAQEEWIPHRLRRWALAVGKMKAKLAYLDALLRLQGLCTVTLDGLLYSAMTGETISLVALDDIDDLYEHIRQDDRNDCSHGPIA